VLENLGRGCPKDLTGLVSAVQSHPQLAVLIQVMHPQLAVRLIQVTRAIDFTRGRYSSYGRP